MRYLLVTLVFLATAIASACEQFAVSKENDTYLLMGKKSKFYDAYKHGKCVLENALEPLPIEQRKIIANLIAKSYLDSKTN